MSEKKIMYGCDGSNKKCKGSCDADSDIHWLTSSFGLCDVCYDKLSKRLPQSIWSECEDILDGSGNDAKEMWEFIVELTK